MVGPGPKGRSDMMRSRLELDRAIEPRRIFGDARGRWAITWRSTRITDDRSGGGCENGMLPARRRSRRHFLSALSICQKKKRANVMSWLEAREHG